jgi:hypothetical protein
VKERRNIEKEFFDKLSPKLGEIKDGFFYLTGMDKDNTAELVLTADGAIKNIVFVEELVNAAPKIPGWKFTALKPAIDIESLSIGMGKFTFDKNNVSFYANEHAAYPDEIDITIVHNNFSEKDKTAITNGVYIYLDNYIGELAFATTIDNLTVTGKAGAKKEPIAIEKLKDFLIWRQKEFVEKYEGIRHNTENDSYSAFEAKLKTGKPLVAIINADLLKWDSKASHPWILTIEIKYDGSKTNGMPNNATADLLNKIEDEITAQLKDYEGYLNIGRQTADNAREIYFACKDFRLPSKVLYNIQRQYAGKMDIGYDIYKDKYWKSFNRFGG